MALKTHPEKLLIFQDMELSATKIKKFLIFWEIELSCSNIKKIFIFSQKEASLIFQEIETLKKIPYISRNGTFLHFGKKNLKNFLYFRK